MYAGSLIIWHHLHFKLPDSSERKFENPDVSHLTCLMIVVLSWMLLLLTNWAFPFWSFSRACQDLVDIDVFLDAKRVIDALQNKEVAPALAWCAENKTRLKKSKVCAVPLNSLFYVSCSRFLRYTAFLFASVLHKLREFLQMWTLLSRRSKSETW